MPCRRCHRRLPEHAVFCPRCGSAARRGDRDLFGTAMYAAGTTTRHVRRGRRVVVAMLVGGALFFLFLFFAAPTRHYSSGGVMLRTMPQGGTLQPGPNGTIVEIDERGMSPEQTRVREMVEQAVREQR